MEALAAIGPAARPALPLMLQESARYLKIERRTEQDEFRACLPPMVIATMGPEVVPELIRTLDDLREQYPDAAVNAINCMVNEVRCKGSAGYRSALPHLIRGLACPNRGAKLACARLLGEMGEDALEAVPALVTLSEETDPIVRQTAAVAVILISNSAKNRSAP